MTRSLVEEWTEALKAFRAIQVLGLVMVLFSSGCGGISQEIAPTETFAPTPLPVTQPASETAEPVSLADEATPQSEDTESPAIGSVTAIHFDLGEAIIEQTWVTNQSDRILPVRLEGMIAAPTTGDHLPIAILIHGSHGVGCPTDERDELQLWPCPEEENHHYEGFAYLLEALAGQGYVAVSIDANPAYVSAFGDPGGAAIPRLLTLFDLYLAQIAAAVNGEALELGVDLAGRVDWDQLVVLGHSLGGAGTVQITNNRVDHTTSEQVNIGQGPIAAAFLVAPESSPPEESYVPVPFAVILPECDRDVSGLIGQFYYEEARQAAQRDDAAISIFLHNANHNRFNTKLQDDDLGVAKPYCASLLPATDVQSFLADYVPKFFDWALGRGAVDTTALALDAAQPAPDRVLGLAALTSLVLPSAQRLRLPLGEEGALGTATAVYCEKGFVTDQEKQGLCGTFKFTQPGSPEEMALTWDGPGAAYEVAVPADSRDLSAYEMLHLRTALDPVSALNAAGESQSFSVQLTDRAGETAVVALTDEPALAFPAGEKGSDDFFEVDTWNNNVILSSLRVPLAAFSGIDLTDVQTISLVFDATDSGAIFLTDLELLR